MRERELIREKWMRSNMEKWSNLVNKIDLEKDKKKFWQGVNRMLGKNSKKEVKILKDENGRDL